MGIRQIFGTSPEAEAEGTRLEFGDFYLIVARAGGSNRKYAKVLERESAPHRRAIDLGKLDEESARKMLKAVYAESIVLGWGGEGLRGALVEGEIPECNRENVLALFNDKVIGNNLFDSVKDAATSIATFQTEDMKADSGN